MIEHLAAKSHKDVASFYDKKYWKDEYGAFSNQDRRIYLDLLQRYGGDFNPDRKILDAGCGHGEFLSFCKNITRYGVDASGGAIDLARRRFKSRKEAVIIQCDMEALHEVFGTTPVFNYISCLGAIEHTMNPKRAFDAMVSLLRPGGVLLLLAPLIFENCLSALQNEENKTTNERFASREEWMEYFGQPIFDQVIGDGESKDLIMVYKKEYEKI